MARHSKTIQIIGFLLILCSLAMLLLSRVWERKAQTEAAELVFRIEAMIPTRNAGIVDGERHRDMPVLQIGGRDFSGVIEVPAFGVTLPIYSVWESTKVTSYPCRFAGTVYDGSLIIGGSDGEGQFSFAGQISIGCRVTVTDMTGAEFTFSVSNVERSKTAAAEVLLDEDADLTLFVRDSYGLDYIIIRCVSGSLPAIS